MRRSGTRVVGPNKVVKVGDVIEVSVEKIDLDKQQIGLSMLTAEGDPLSKYGSSGFNGITGLCHSEIPIPAGRYA
jgi:transcriptional accessory protein Tex/SPT6